MLVCVAGRDQRPQERRLLNESRVIELTTEILLFDDPTSAVSVRQEFEPCLLPKQEPAPQVRRDGLTPSAFVFVNGRQLVDVRRTEDFADGILGASGDARERARGADLV